MNEQYLVVEISSQTASFRNPEFQNFHKTFNLPPPTCVIGLAGAALGLGPGTTQLYFNSAKWKLGIYGFSKGKAVDLWKYRNLKKKGEPTSILKREFLFDNHFVLVFNCEKASELQKLELAFNYPKYAITIGNSDSLAKIHKVYTTNKVIKSNKIANCMVEDDVVSKVLAHTSEEPEFSVYTTSDPIACDLPVSFSYKSDYGVRSVNKRKTFSFIGTHMELNFEVEGIEGQDIYDNDFFVPILSTK